MERRRSVKYHLENVNILTDCMLNDSNFVYEDLCVLKEHLQKLYEEVCFEEKSMLEEEYLRQKNVHEASFFTPNVPPAAEKEQQYYKKANAEEEKIEEEEQKIDTEQFEEQQPFEKEEQELVEEQIDDIEENVVEENVVEEFDFLEDNGEEDNDEVIDNPSDSIVQSVEPSDIEEEIEENEIDTIDDEIDDRLAVEEYIVENQQETIGHEDDNDEPVTAKSNDEMFAPKSIGDVVGQAAEHHTLGDKISKTRVNNLKSAIDISDKFMFIKNLFDNDVKVYNETIDKFSNFTSKNDAMIYLQLLSNRFDWDYNSRIYQKFESIIQRRFD